MNIYSTKQLGLSSNQSGQAAIFVTLILMVVISIISLGVYEVSARSSREALDSQLSVQAGYAAESGINDAITALQNPTVSTPTATGCNSFTGASPNSTFLPNAGSGVISSSSKIAYTCLIVNPHPTSLPVTGVSDDQSTVMGLQPSNPNGPLTFTWQKTSAAGNTSGCTKALQFVQPINWYGTCPFPVLRVDVFDDLNYATGSNYAGAAQLEEDTNSYYMFPIGDGSVTAATDGDSNVTFGAASLATTQQPKVIYGYCTDTTVPSTCTATLNFNAATTFANGYARLTTYYADNAPDTVTVTGAAGTSFSGTIEIDSTGIAQDETQRLDVRVNANSSSTSLAAPSFAVNVCGGDFCKRYALSGGVTADPDVLNNGNENTGAPLCGFSLKPAIYLYPTHTELANVKVSWPTGLKTTIPTINPVSGWDVLAQPNGTLTNIADGKTYPYLYWEGNMDNFDLNMSQGFVVPGKDTATFLKQELKTIGLNQNEINGFLQYWVPKMENNPYSLIHFAGNEYTNMAPLDITPKPDSMLRVFMAEESINQPVKVTPQHFTTFHRSGFTAVEWGGSVLNSPSSATDN